MNFHIFIDARELENILKKLGYHKYQNEIYAVSVVSSTEITCTIRNPASYVGTIQVIEGVKSVIQSDLVEVIKAILETNPTVAPLLPLRYSYIKVRTGASKGNFIAFVLTQSGPAKLYDVNIHTEGVTEG